MFQKKSRLDDAGLALVARVGEAIASKVRADDPRGITLGWEDSNPHTAELSAYDLARLISYVGGPRPDAPMRRPDAPRRAPGEQIIWSMAETVKRTVDEWTTAGVGAGRSVRVARAAWLRYELSALGLENELPAEVWDRLDDEGPRPGFGRPASGLSANGAG